jgi:nucleotide-binding universal stress UspA family protein/sporulation protein YlmC with PRC-barrel domain
MQRRILVPLDGSTLADQVIAQLRRLLVRSDHETVLLTVVPGDPDPVKLDRARQDARDHLAGVRDALIDQGALASVEVLVGSPAEQIVEHARRIEADLVVMATHGRSGLSRFVRGSVAEAVIRACPAPVLVANPRAVDVSGPGGELRLGKLLVPLDGSAESQQVLPLVEAVAKRYDAEVLLLRVEWVPPLATHATASAPALLRSMDEIAAALEPVRQQLAAQGIRARALAGHGPEALTILDTADREQVDLVVMSTHGRSGLSRWLFGSVAEQVLRHCTRPLLVRRVHAGSEAPARGASAASASQPAHGLSARELIGAKVQDLTHADLGTVDDLALDPATGRVSYAILRFGGLLGVGEKLFPVPWSALHWRPADGTFVLQHHGKKRDELKDAPHLPHPHRRERQVTFTPDLAPAVHSFYPGPRFF